MSIDALIQFLTENLFFVIIIIGGLFSFFKRLSSANDANKNQQKKRPLPPVSKPFFDVDQQTPERQFEPEFEEMITENIGIPTEKAKFDRSQEELSPIELVSPKNERRRKSITKINKAGFQHPTKEEVTRGIIWSEILGPPRALKPYSRIRR